MSGRQFSFEVNRTSTASAATLFRLETDGAGWSQWIGFIPYSAWDRQGDPAPGGIGAVRKFGLPPVLLREETVGYEQDRRHVYRMVSPPSPAKDYHGEVTFTPNASGGTDIQWTGSFTERLRGTGPALRVALRSTISAIANCLVKAAESEPGKHS